MKPAEPDRIEVHGLRVRSCIGVPDAERDAPQELLVDLRLFPQFSFSQMPDAIAATVDYAHVAGRVSAIAAGRPRQLIETLAEEIAAALLRDYPLIRVEVRVRKFILPNTDFVAVRCVRERNH